MWMRRCQLWLCKMFFSSVKWAIEQVFLSFETMSSREQEKKYFQSQLRNTGKIYSVFNWSIEQSRLHILTPSENKNLERIIHPSNVITSYFLFSLPGQPPTSKKRIEASLKGLSVRVCVCLISVLFLRRVSPLSFVVCGEILKHNAFSGFWWTRDSQLLSHDETVQ